MLSIQGFYRDSRISYDIKAYKPQNVERKTERYAFVILIVKKHQNEFYEKSLQIDY